VDSRYRNPSYRERSGPTTPTRAARLADASVDQTDARNLLLGYFDANSSVAKSRPIAPPQSEVAVDAGADHLQGGLLGPCQVVRWKASATA
jgi:hypothetical protein